MTTVRETRAFFHVTIDGRTVEVAKGIGAGRISEADAVAKAGRILAARDAS